MSGFSPQWLALREPYDLRARNADILNAACHAIAGKPCVVIVDLACGTGSTCHALGPRIKSRQQWRLLDNDLSLLARVPAPPSPLIELSPVPIDLNLHLEAAFDAPVDLVTMSALLDLVSDDWLNRFAIEAAARRLPVYAALTYDGRIELQPDHPLDRRIVEAVHRHQRTDKSFGPALGPAAPLAAVGVFERLGYSVTRGAADWVFGPQDRDIQTEVLSGWAWAAREIGDPPWPEVLDWLKRRRQRIGRGQSSMRVGHVDFLALPTTRR